MTPQRGFKLGLVASALLLFLALMVLLVLVIRAYDGYCISLEPPARRCSLFEYSAGVAVLLALIITTPGSIHLLVWLFFVLPIIGHLVGQRKARLAALPGRDSKS
jgi:hypothetical protein